MLLYIVRHGDPIYETDSLTERGKLQAEAVGKRMFDAKIDRIFSSPMGRAMETAEPACRLLGLEKNIEEWTHELGAERITPFPDGNPKSITFVQNTYFLENGANELSYKDSFDCPGINQSQMKSAASYIEERGKDFLRRLGYQEENGVYRILKNNEERVALFCHVGFAKTWLSSLLHIPFHIMWASFDYTHTGVTVIEFKNNENGITAPRCLCYSDVSHLYSEKLDLKYNNGFEL